MNIFNLSAILAMATQILILIVCVLAISVLFKNLTMAHRNDNAQKFPKLASRTKKQRFNSVGEYLAFLIVVVILGICAFSMM